MSDNQNLRHQIDTLKLQLADEKQAGLHYQSEAERVEAAAQEIVKTAYAAQSALVDENTHMKLRVKRAEWRCQILLERHRSGKALSRKRPR